jgi:hypothetical protein
MPAVLESGLMTSLCTITVPPAIFDAGGAPDPNAPYTVLEGHEDIPCTAPPLSTGDGTSQTEQKSMTQILAKSVLHVLLGGWYPAIICDYRAVIDGNVYDITNVESDSKQKMTRMAVQAVTT